MKRPWLVLAGFVLASLGPGFLGTLFGNTGFYREIERPSWAPPGAVFGPVWTVLYLMMGTAAWLVWRQPPAARRRRALTLFWVQLGLNALWIPIFFGLQSIGVALVEIAVLLVAIALTTAAFFRVSRAAGGLFLPYLGWVAFATALNAAIWTLNR
jgi:tryptophan-rich sensory protein